MKPESRAYILSDAVEYLDYEKEIEEMEESFEAIGVEIQARASAGRIVVEVPENVDDKTTRDILAELGFEVEGVVNIGEPSGRELIFDIEYTDDGQTVSSAIDEGQVLFATDQRLGSETPSLELVLTALSRDIEFSYGYYLIGGGLEIRDICLDREFWDEEKARTWHPQCWDEDEPKLEVSVIPQASLVENGELIDIHIDGLSSSWSVPVRLLPANFDIGSPASYDDLALLPCVPKKVRDWSSMSAFRVEIENPEILAEPETGPGF
jgi:hypothetical protein